MRLGIRLFRSACLPKVPAWRSKPCKNCDRFPIRCFNSIRTSPARPLIRPTEGGFGQNDKAIGQQVPVICYPFADNYMLCDGARRVLAIRMVGIDDVLSLVLPANAPDATTLRIAQMSVEAHTVGLSPWERSCFLFAIKEDNQWSVSDLAARLSMKQASREQLAYVPAA